MKVLIGLIGKPRVGKGTVAGIITKLLEEKGITSKNMRFSDPLNDILKILNIPNSRTNLQNLALVLRNGISEDVLARAMEHKILQTKGDVIILDGIRWIPDFAMIKKLGGITIYIKASLETAFRRTLRSQEKAGESETTLDQFLAQQKAESEKYIEAIGEHADFVLENDEDDDASPSAPKVLTPRVEMIIGNLVIPILEIPTEEGKE